MGNAIAKTNAGRVLDRLGLPYELRAYRSDPADLSPERLEREIGLSRGAIFKTLVGRGDRTGPLFAVIPTACEIDLKQLARVSNDKRVELLARAELASVVGYVRGAVTALAAKKALPVYLEASALEHTRIGVSAGALGLELVLAPQDYVRATAAVVASITQSLVAPA